MTFSSSMNPARNARLLRGAQMIENGIEPKQLAKDRFEIPQPLPMSPMSFPNMLTNGDALALTTSSGTSLVNTFTPSLSGRS
jgi:hypothetical protein